MISFATVWQNYPQDGPCRDSKGKEPEGYSNQCAIKVGYALEKSGVSFASFRGARCPFDKKNGGMVARAQELADWLSPDKVSGLAAVETYKGEDIATAFEKIKGRTGIIFLADYWQRTGEKGQARTGDHIDLWNGSRLTTWTSILRVHLRIAWDGAWSDYYRASQIRFWEMS